LTVRCWEVPFHFPPRLAGLAENKTIRFLKSRPPSRLTGDHCLDDFGTSDHVIMGTLDKPVEEKKGKLASKQEIKNHQKA
jgi:hypothetical protein